MNTYKRNEEIKNLHKKGMKLAEIGRKYGFSRERARQIVNNVRPLYVPKIILLNRITCIICRSLLDKKDTKYCRKCFFENKLGSGGRELTRGIVRGRDDNTCQSCGIKWKLGMDRKRFDVHHLGNVCGKKSRKYDKVSDDLSKLITVCHKCHFNLHTHSRFNKK